MFVLVMGWNDYNVCPSERLQGAKNLGFAIDVFQQEILRRRSAAPQNDISN